MKSSSSRERTPRGATQPAASRRGWRQEYYEAARQAAAEARSMENELTRPRDVVVQPSNSGASQPATPADTDGVRSLGDSRTCGAPSQSSEPNSANLVWFVLDPSQEPQRTTIPRLWPFLCNSLDFMTTPPILLSLLRRPRRGVPAAVRPASSLPPPVLLSLEHLCVSVCMRA